MLSLNSLPRKVQIGVNITKGLCAPIISTHVDGGRIDPVEPTSTWEEWIPNSVSVRLSNTDEGES